MIRCNLYHVNSFTRDKLTGNPAAVISKADGLSDVIMQRLASELNLPSTVFILKPSDKSHDTYLRFFTPTREEPLCGHGALAAHYVMASENKLGSSTIYQRTGAGILSVDILNINNEYLITMAQGKIEYGDILNGEMRKRVLLSLGVDDNDTTCGYPIQIVSTGNPKLLVPVDSCEILHGINPNLEMIYKLSKMLQVSGFYVFCLTHSDPLIHGRMFAPAYGVNEDPVTGNANSPLGAYLVKNKIVNHNSEYYTFNAIQGEKIGRTGSMSVTVIINDNIPVDVQISGSAVIVYKAKLEIAV